MEENFKEKLITEIDNLLEEDDKVGTNLDALSDEEELNQETETEIGIEGAISGIVGANKFSSEEKKKAATEKFAKKRKILEKERVGNNQKRLKQSKFPTRSDDFLRDNLKALHIVFNHGRENIEKHENEIYTNGIDFTARKAIGVRHFGRENRINVFQRLVELQDTIRKYKGNGSQNFPQWFIFSNVTSIILDVNILDRLDSLKPTTAAVGAFGFKKINKNGRFFEPDSINETCGCFLQADLNSNNFDYIVGHEFIKNPKTKVAIIHGPIICIRGPVFMSIDFIPLASKCKFGYYHYMADMSLECLSRGFVCGTIKTITEQFDNVKNHVGENDFKHDHAIFLEKWKEHLPIQIP